MQQGDHGLDDGIQNHLETYINISQTVTTVRTSVSMYGITCCLGCHTDTMSCNLLSSCNSDVLRAWFFR